MGLNYVWCGVCSLNILYRTAGARWMHSKISFREESQTQMMWSAFNHRHRHYISTCGAFISFCSAWTQILFCFCKFPCWTLNINMDSCICNWLSISIKSIHIIHAYVHIFTFSLVNMMRIYGKRWTVNTFCNAIIIDYVHMLQLLNYS